MSEIYAEDVNYWQTGKSSPDTWIMNARREITAAGGRVAGEAFGSDDRGRSVYMLEFTFGQEHFRVVWPALRSRTNNVQAARVQAATFLYHEIKARCMAAKVLGVHASFFSYLLLPDGRTAATLAAPELTERWPKLLTSGENRP